MASNKSAAGGANISRSPVNGKDAVPSMDGKITSSDRLPSFRLPRDLTLGGMQLKGTVARPNLLQANKKVYTPNLNVVRNKNVDVKTSRDTTKPNLRGRGRGARTPNDRTNAAASKSRNNLVSTVGLFSQGAGDGTAKQLYRSVRGSSDQASGAALRRPVLSAKREKVDPVLEKKQIAEIYDMDEDIEENNAGDSTSDIFAPIILAEPKIEIKIEDRLNVLNIKNETPDTDSLVETNANYPTNLDEFFDRTSPQFFLLQLPDTLPGHGADPEPGDSAEADQLNDSNQWDNLCNMNNVDDGQIGRLVRYRSGKTKLIINETEFDLDLGIDPHHLQEILSIDTDTDRRSGNMINIGQIGANLFAVPDWESILYNADNSNS